LLFGIIAVSVELELFGMEGDERIFGGMTVAGLGNC